MQQYNKIKN